MPRPASRSPRAPRAAAGFTLIELMITVVIVGILSAIAIPAYNAYVMKGYLSAAQNALTAQATAMGQFAQDNETYVGSCASPVTVTNFTLSCGNLSTTGYTITATGTGTAAGFVFTLDSAGTKATTSAASGWTANAGCWISDKAGDCSIQ